MRIPVMMALAILPATPVAAFEFTGATLGYDYREADDVGQRQVTGNAAFALGSGFGVQIGLKHAEYDDDLISNAQELHLTYGGDAGYALGLFVGRENFGPSDFEYYGIEGAYAVGALSLEAAISDYSGDGYDATDYLIDAEYGLGDRFALLAGYHMSEESAVDLTRYYVGASYDIIPDLSLSATYGETDFEVGDDQIVTLDLTYRLGKGVTFSQRNYTTNYPAD